MNKKYVSLIILLLLISATMTACMDVPAQPSTQQIEQRQNEDNQQKLIQSQPVPTLDKSLERENIIRRLELLNDNDKVFFVYLVSYGKVMTYFTAKGKVSSVNSYLTSFSQIVRDEDCIHNTDFNGQSGCYFAVEAPDLDGTYGENGDAVYFFTTEGAYVEWKGEYMVSDYPLRLTTPVALTREVE